MCLVKKPHISDDPAKDDKLLPILRNQFLDGMLGNVAALRNGRNSLRIPLNPLGIPVGGGVGGGGVGGYGGSSSSTSGGSTSSVGGGGSTGSGFSTRDTSPTVGRDKA